MALDGRIVHGAKIPASREREASSARSRPEIGTAALVALGHALDPTPSRSGDYYTRRAPLERLRAITELRDVLEELERLEVGEAIKDNHLRWEDVGQALGTSRSAAHRKHAGAVELERRQAWR